MPLDKVCRWALQWRHMTHPLQKYLDENDMSQGAFADLIGFDRITVNRIINGGGFSPKFVRKACEATGGKLTPSDFFGVAA